MKGHIERVTISGIESYGEEIVACKWFFLVGACASLPN